MGALQNLTEKGIRSTHQDGLQTSIINQDIERSNIENDRLLFLPIIRLIYYTHAHIHSHTTFAGLFYKDYAGDYTERFSWQLPHSSFSAALFSFKLLLFICTPALSFLLLQSPFSCFLSLLKKKFKQGEVMGSGASVLTFQSRF